jgi:hypothetical protein
MPKIERVKQGVGAALARLNVETTSPGGCPEGVDEKPRGWQFGFKTLSERLIDR